MTDDLVERAVDDCHQADLVIGEAVQIPGPIRLIEVYVSHVDIGHNRIVSVALTTEVVVVDIQS